MSDKPADSTRIYEVMTNLLTVAAALSLVAAVPGFLPAFVPRLICALFGSLWLVVAIGAKYGDLRKK